jgi:hypothetical protein
MQTATQIISTLIGRNIFGQVSSNFKFTEEALTSVLRRHNNINTKDVNLQQIADMLNNYYSDKLFHNHGISEDLNGVSPTSGYMVSLAGKESQHPDYSTIPADVVNEVCREYHQTIEPNTYFGAWIDEDILYLDNSVNIEDIETATAFGRANNQIAIWDVVNRKTIYLNK